MCPGCYKINLDGYCSSCRKKLFNGKDVKPVLSFEQPKQGNLKLYQEKTKRLSISGVQLKYSLLLDGKELKLTETNGQYIIKPIPLSAQIENPDQAPENEHLTMQIAEQIFNIKTAANALIYFADGAPAYLTKRFDVKSDGSKFQQEDMAQLSGRSRHTAGENFKYEGNYEHIGTLIQKFVAAYPLAMENLFRIILFNYLFSNGDAHLKNFSLLQSEMGDYNLSPAYDLMSTVIHTPLEADTALDLYRGDMETDFYNRYGFFGQIDFRIFAKKIGVIDLRTTRIITNALLQKEKVLELVQRSFLSEEMKSIYTKKFLERLYRMDLTL